MNRRPCGLAIFFRLHASAAAVLLTVLLAVSAVRGFPLSNGGMDRPKLRLEASRRAEVMHTAALFVGLCFAAQANAMPPQKSYSTNARNLDRLNGGDSSAGSVYDNNPSAPAARKRRAMQGCKIASARGRAATILGKPLSEKDCNMQVMQESPDFILQALQELDCPTCPYGVKQ
jgi:hypothetical protein